MRLAKQLVTSLIMLFVVGTVLSARSLTEAELFRVKNQGYSDAEMIGRLGTVDAIEIDLSDRNAESLKSRGISEALIKALRDRKDELDKKSGKVVSKISVAETEAKDSAQFAQAAQSSDCPAGFGVYYLSPSKEWISVEAHRPEAKIVVGDIKSAEKWEFSGREAPLKIADTNIEFCVRGKAASPSSIALAILQSHKDKRDVVYSSQNKFGRDKGRTSDNFRPVDAERAGDGAIIVKISNLQTGAYALDLVGKRPDYDFQIAPKAR